MVMQQAGDVSYVVVIREALQVAIETLKILSCALSVFGGKALIMKE